MRRTQNVLLTLAGVCMLILWPLEIAGQQTGDARRSTEPPGTAAASQEVFERALAAISEHHRDVFSDSLLWAKALEGLVQSLDDPYAAVFTPEEVEAFEEETTGNYSGIGVQITQLGGDVTVTAVFRGTPADEVGLLVGDVIVGVDGDAATEWTTSDISDRIRGPEGTDVQVAVRREGFSDTVSFEIERAEVHVPAVEADTLRGGVGYVTIDRVARGSAQEVDSVLQALKDARGVVLDLRRNPGGYLDESLMMADVFLEPGQTLASLRTRSAGSSDGEPAEESWADRMPARIPDKPLIVLVDGFTASAAEIVTGALQDHDRALVIGERTFGKGVVQTVLDLPHGHKLRITTGTWHTPLGRILHRARDGEGRPLAEDLDTFPRIRTASGRELLGAGGIFPDLTIEADSLRAAERRLLQLSAEHEVPLGLRLQEFAFQEAQALRAEGRDPELRAGSLETLVATLEDDGLPPEVLDDPIGRDYLAWRARVTIADRMEAIGAAATFRMERDPVLAEAVRLLRTSSSQRELLAAGSGGRPDRGGEGGSGGG